jgi:predicted acylesterase/phospholipase RssA
MAEAGILARVEVVSAVSGGSVAAAALISAVASNGPAALEADGFVRHVFEPFVATVTSDNLMWRTVRHWSSGRLAARGRPRNLVLAETLEHALFPGAEVLVGLPERPQVVIVGTELAVGRAFRFAKPFLGSFDFGYVPPPPDMRVSTAVAASAAAPPLLPPLQLETAGLGLRNAPALLAITDGGVYDNLGLQWFQGWEPHRRPAGAVAASDLVVVNASGSLQRKDGRLQGLRALNRMRKVQYAQTQATRVSWLVRELEAGRQRGLYLGITADPRAYRLPPPGREPADEALVVDALPSRLVAALAGLRTDFDRFSESEAALLAYHGYRSAHARFASLRPDRAVSQPSWREFAGMSDAEAAGLEQELTRPRHQIGIGERLR